MSFFLILLQSFVTMAWLVVLGRMLMSWVDPQFQRPISQFLYSITEPFIAPIRNVLPQTGMFDFAPLVLLIGLGLFWRILVLA